MDWWQKLSELVGVQLDPNGNPLGAAALLDKFSEDLKKLAASIRAHVNEQHKGRPDANGVSDRLKVKVVGPNGHIKQHVDTGASAQ